MSSPLSPDDPRHGTYAGAVRGCRCEPCREARHEYHRGWRNRAQGTLTDDDNRHGTVNGHDNYGCRCPRCRSAHFQALSDYYARLAEQLLREATNAPSHS